MILLSATLSLTITALVGIVLASQPATSPAILLRASQPKSLRNRQNDQPELLTTDDLMHFAKTAPRENRHAPHSPRGDSPMMSRPWWGYLGLGFRRPEQPVVGKNAKVRWWQRLRAVVMLAVIVVLLGVAVAGLIGAMVFLAGYLLETAVS